ncbi:MAG: glycosyltransferase family 4 protein [Minisyncoccia bacterium]|jgi:glycosyltransferase involved in cell wall biosynthesis
MKRILIFSLAYYPHVGGAEVAIKEITDRITGIEFHIVTMRFTVRDVKEEKIGNVVVHRVGNGAGYVSKILFVPRAARMALTLNKTEPFDAWWAMMSYMTLPIVLLRSIGLRLPYALTLQEGDTSAHMFGRLHILPFLPFINYGFRHASVVQAISVFLGEWAIERKYTGPLEIIPNGVDGKKFVGEKIPHEGIVLITTSRLVHKNAIDDVIKALAFLPAQVRFVILGIGPDESGLKALAKKMGVENRIEFVGHVDHKDIPEYLHKADMFIRPSRSEGMGNSFIEAMAAGLPVIATQEGGIADFLFDAKRNPGLQPTGFAVDKDSSEQIAAAVQEILQHPEQTKKIVDTARTMVFEKYDWDVIANDMRQKVFGRILTV